MKRLIPVLSLLLILLSCENEPLGRAELPDDYPAPVEEWQEYRIGVLTEPTGWLRLKDLIWLGDGENSFGTAADTDIRFPDGSIADYAGSFVLNDGKVVMNVSDSVEITHDGSPVSNFLLFDPDREENPNVKHGDLEWFVDQRGDQLGIRIYSMDTPKADAFDGFPRYPVEEEWYRKARFIPASEGKTIRIINVLGEEVDRPSPGSVEFTIDGELYTLDAFETRSGLFLMMSDLTNQTETYQAGRYMIIDPPDDDGYTVIDFNKVYNPPCAFSTFTTCQLPPPQNRLEVSIPAGEKRPVDWEGL